MADDNNQNDADAAAAKATVDADAAKAKADADAALGDAGKKALQTERDARKVAEARVKELEGKLIRKPKDHVAPVDGAPDLDAIKAELRGEFASQILSTEIKADAKGRVVDAAEAVTRYPEYFKDLKAGDEKAITAAVDKLLKDKPYLAAAKSAQWRQVDGGGDSVKPEPTSAQDRMARAYGAKK